MNPVVRTLIDPELVVPNSGRSSSLAFWARLEAWTRVDIPHIGPETLRALGELLAQPPQVPGLATYEFRKIIGRVASRLLTPANPTESCCEAHVMNAYSPYWGDDQNPIRLAFDVAGFPLEHAVVVATVPDVWSGGPPLSVAGCTACSARRLHFQTSPGNAPSAAWRAEVVRHGLTEISLRDHAASMFPNITFADGAWQRSGAAIGGSSSLADLLHHLAVLNDHAPTAWISHVETHARQQALAAHGVDASPESSGTRRNAAALAERSFIFGGVVVSCQWHTKITPTSGRVHFEVQDDRVLVGAIVEHLTT